MQDENFIPKIKVDNSIADTKLNTFITPMRMDAMIESPEHPTGFQGVMASMLAELDSTVKAPDNAMQDMLAGNSGVDVHDVMIAMSKADLAVNIATSVSTKAIQAYEKVMSIQV